LSFFLKGRAVFKLEKGWALDISAVKVTVKYAIATGRLEWTPYRRAE
jgi:hypothetical protein